MQEGQTIPAMNIKQVLIKNLLVLVNLNLLQKFQTL